MTTTCGANPRPASLAAPTSPPQDTIKPVSNPSNLLARYCEGSEHLGGHETGTETSSKSINQRLISPEGTAAAITCYSSNYQEFLKEKAVSHLKNRPRSILGCSRASSETGELEIDGETPFFRRKSTVFTAFSRRHGGCHFVSVKAGDPWTS